MKNQLGQLFFIGIKGTTVSPEETKFLIDHNIGGVTLFARNIQSPEQVYKLNAELQNIAQRMPDRLPLFIAIDMEGGRVQRLKEPFTIWPPLKKLGDLNSTSLAFKFGQAMGAELQAVGINLDFAPTVDVFTNPKNQVIGDRAAGTDPELVAKIGSALIRGYIKADVIPCAKHFPGHGNTLADSHEELPVDDASLELLHSRELVPFKKAMRARLDFIMTGHIKFPKIDPDLPVTLSPIFIKKLLRDELRFRQLIISDDLDMKALANHYDKDKIPVMALQAGCDILLYCNEAESPPRAFAACMKAIAEGTVNKAQIQESYKKIVEIKRKKIPAVRPWSESQKLIGCEEHQMIADAIREGRIPEGLAADTE